MAKRFDAPYFEASVSRLLVDLNRSRSHAALHSEFSKKLSPAQRTELVARYYEPFRARVLDEVSRALTLGFAVIHLSVHSFTPRLGGVERRADVGLLYDPRRRSEREVCESWRFHLRQADPSLVVRRNYPYRGHADGHTTALRRALGGKPYLGIELELNQALRDGRGEFPESLFRTLCATLEHATSAELAGAQ